MVKEFKVTLSREELKALSTFKPEFKEILDEADRFYCAYISKLQMLCGPLNFLSSHDYKEHMTKVQFVRNVLTEYFFNSEISLQIKEYKLVTDFEKFMDKLYWISNSMVFILDNPGELDSCEVNQQCSCYLNELKLLIKE